MANATAPPSGGLVFVRITLGALATQTGWAWAAKDGLTGSIVKHTIREHLDNLWAPARFWGGEVLLYNPDAIAFLVSWLTLFSGVALLIGALTRPAATFAAIMGLHLFFYDASTAQPLAILITACGLGCALSRAGRRFGLDAALDGNLPGWMTWVKSDAGFLGR